MGNNYISAPTPRGKKFQYSWTFLFMRSQTDFVDKLAQYGAEGWEVVHMEPNEDKTGYDIYFKRELAPEDF